MSDPELKGVQESLHEAVEIGHRLLQDDYDAMAAVFLEAHKLYGFVIEMQINGQNKPLIQFCVDTPDQNKTVYQRQQEYYKKLKKIGCENLQTVYNTRWDCPESLEHYKQLSLEGAQKRQEDKKKFFNLLMEHYDEWWD